MRAYFTNMKSDIPSPAIIKEAMSKIEELTGIKRSEKQIWKFLKSIGIKRLKVGSILLKPIQMNRKLIKKEKMEPRLEEAKAGLRAVFFLDSAHFVLAPFPGYLWTFTRIFIKAPAGRNRFNVLDALNAITHELITVTIERLFPYPEISDFRKSSICDPLKYKYLPVRLMRD